MILDYGSVCSGIEAASVAWRGLGFEPAWFSEIEAFPSSVLGHHWPHVLNMGDMLAIPGHVRLRLINAPLILVGGTPCQAFSIAGLRNGLADERGALTLAYVDILNSIDEVRGLGDEAVAVYENVPGVLSSRDNAFGFFLAGLAGENCELQPPGGRWPNAGCVFGPQRAVAWRVLDAQYFGVAQRRKRVFVVGSARKGIDPQQILFEFEGLRRDIKPGFADKTSIHTTDSTTRAFDMLGFGQYGPGITCNTLKARDSKDATALVVQEGKVRKLIPEEYARLQGFPDAHCAIGPANAQYAAYGNSMAVPCMKWLGERLLTALSRRSNV